MSHNLLLEAGKDTTNLVTILSGVACVCLLAVIAVIGTRRRQGKKRLAFAGICVALSFVLAYLKIKPVQYGGSVTLASFVPAMIYAYAFGVGNGLMVGIILGLLNFIESPYILTPMTFLLDYVLAFASIGAFGLFGKMQAKKRATALLLGTLTVYAIRFFFHYLSGVIFFTEGALWVSFPDWAMSNAWLYSFVYQCVYIPLDALLSLTALLILERTGVLERLLGIMQKDTSIDKKKKKSKNGKR